VTAIFAFILQLAVLLHPATTGEHTRVVIADGSAWANIVVDEPGGEALRSTERLCDCDLATRWIATDLDGDGREDLVAIRFDSFGTHVELWHNGFNGFARQMASPRHFLRPLVHALREAIASLMGLPTPIA
jgi:hypothetical protein